MSFNSLTLVSLHVYPAELMQTEMHHIRTLRIMSEVYSKGLQKEVQLELQTVDKLFPALDELLELHTQHLLRLLERKRESQLDGGSFDGGFIINRIGDILVNQVREEKDCCDGDAGSNVMKLHAEYIFLFKGILYELVLKEVLSLQIFTILYEQSICLNSTMSGLETYSMNYPHFLDIFCKVLEQL